MAVQQIVCGFCLPVHSFLFVPNQLKYTCHNAFDSERFLNRNHHRLTQDTCRLCLNLWGKGMELNSKKCCSDLMETKTCRQ